MEATHNPKFTGSEYRLYSEIIRALYPIVNLHRTNVTVRKTIRVPRLDKGGNTVRNERGKVVYDDLSIPIRTGLPTGYPDLSGNRRSDGRAVFIECKVGYNKPSEEQEKYIESRRSEGCLAGVCRSVQDALDLVCGK